MYVHLTQLLLDIHVGTYTNSDTLGVVLTSERLLFTPRMVEHAVIQSPSRTPAPGRP